MKNNSVSPIKTDESELSPESLKIDFINDICECWKGETAEIKAGSTEKEENIFTEISSLFGKG